MNTNDIGKKAKETTDSVKESAQDMMDDPQGEMIASAKDWTNYIQKHPLQSLLFGLIGYFALKGMCK